MQYIKYAVCSAAGLIGGLVSWLFGGWDSSIVTLLTFMAIDYLTGLIVAGIFKKSPKTESGTLQSKVGWKGLAKKVMTLLFVLIGVRLDITLGTDYIRDAVCIAFITNELLSIIENAGLMGIPIPAPIKKAIDILRSKEEDK